MIAIVITILLPNLLHAILTETKYRECSILYADKNVNMADPENTNFIQHTATIDSGNSGWPLLIEDITNPTGYTVAGVNTWKIMYLQNVNFSIPAGTVLKIMEKTREKEERLSDRGFQNTMGNRAILIGLRSNIGMTRALGSRYDYFPYEGGGGLTYKSGGGIVTGFSFGAEIEYSLTPYLWVGTGLNYLRRGTSYERLDDNLDYYEYIGYLQVPFIIKYKRHLFIGCGAGLDYAVSLGGKKVNFLTDSEQKLNPSYYSNLNRFNIAGVVTVGWESEVDYVLRHPPVVFGIDATFNYHLLSDKDFKSHFYSILMGAFIKFIIFR
jgi:hypothetical protein